MGKHNNKYYRSEQDDDEDDGKPSGGGFWENLLPWNWDFGGILMGLALLVGGYFLLRNEKVQEAIGKFMGKDAQDMVHGLVENIDLFVGGLTNNGALGHKLEAMNADDAKKFLTDQKMDETVVNTLTATTDTWQDFIKTVEEANGGKLSKPGQFTSPETITALILKKPELVNKLLVAMKPGANPTDDQKKMFADYMESMRAIVGSDKLDQLLSPANRRNTLSLLLKIMPDLGKDPDIAINMLTSTGLIGADGKPSTALRTMLTTALTPDSDGKLPDTKALMATLLNSNDPTVKALVEAKITQQAAAFVGTKNAPLVATLHTDLGNDNFAAFSALADAAQKSHNYSELTTFVLKTDNQAAFRKFFDDIDVSALPADQAAFKAQVAQFKALPAAAFGPVGAIADNGVNPLAIQTIFLPKGNKTSVDDVIAAVINHTNRELLSKAGADNIAKLIPMFAPQYQSFLTAGNFQTLLKAAETIDQNPKNSTNPTTVKATFHVLDAFVNFATTGDARTLSGLNGEETANFFKNNYQAVHDMLAGLDGSKLPDQKSRAIFESFKKHFGTPDKGMADALDDKDSAQFLLAMLQGKSGKNTPWWDWSSDGSWSAPKDIKDNKEDLEAIKTDLQKAGVSFTSTGASTTHSTTNSNTPGLRI